MIPRRLRTSLLVQQSNLISLKQMNRLPLIIAIIAIIAAVAVSVLLYKTDNTLKETANALSQTENKLVSTQQELSEEQATTKNQEAQISKLTDNSADLRQEISKLNSEIIAATNEVKQTQRKISDLNSEISKLKENEGELKEKLIAAQTAKQNEMANLAQLKERIEELETANSQLKTDLENTTTQLARSANSTRESTKNDSGLSIRTRPSYSFSPNSIGPEVTIASIRPADGVMTISNPAAAGITPGQTYTLVKDLTAIAKIQVTEIQGDLAITHILPGTRSKLLAEGLTANLMYR